MAKAGHGDHDGQAKANLDRDAQRKVEGKTSRLDDDRRETLTPGDGAGPRGRQGDEVDPGVG